MTPSPRTAPTPSHARRLRHLDRGIARSMSVVIGNLRGAKYEATSPLEKIPWNPWVGQNLGGARSSDCPGSDGGEPDRRRLAGPFGSRSKSRRDAGAPMGAGGGLG